MTQPSAGCYITLIHVILKNNKMKLFRILIPIALAALLMSATQRPIHIFLAGDSTMANKTVHRSVMVDSATGERANVRFPERGWGMMLQDFFKEGSVVVENHARNGRATRDFMNEGRWQVILERLQPGDFVVIQFGHNDQPKTKGNRYSSPEDYRINLEMMAKHVLEKGATPILTTSVARRSFNDDGTLKNSHGVYPSIVLEVAKELGVPAIDMNKYSTRALEAAGPEKSIGYFMHFPAGIDPNFPKGITDNTHFRSEGAIKMAELFVGGLREADIQPLVERLRDNYDYRQ